MILIVRGRSKNLQTSYKYGPKVIELTLVVINGIQALYHYPSLGRVVDLSIVRLELQTTSQFDNFDGERNDLLTSFCEYQGPNSIGNFVDSCFGLKKV